MPFIIYTVLVLHSYSGTNRSFTNHNSVSTCVPCYNIGFTASTYIQLQYVVTCNSECY